MRNFNTLFISILSLSPLAVISQSSDISSSSHPIDDFLGGIYSDIFGSSANNDPLPSLSATLDTKTLILSTDFKITNVPQIREYNFEFKAVKANPDGYERQIYTINGQFPAPLIEANTGDTIRVHVKNSLDIPQTIHWHGLTQNGSNVMDGVPGVTQCPIPPGGSFTYEFPIVQQYGTYWYHSHFANTMADGLAGPFIVHSPDDPIQRGRDFDEERVLMITDWMHDQSTNIVAALKSEKGYRGSPAAPRGDSILINGVGKANCSDPNYPSGALSHSMLRVSIDQHPFEVVETDTTAINGPTALHEIPIAPAQRYSIIVNSNQGKAGDKFWLRVNVAAGCMDKVRQEGLAIFRYTNDNEEYDDKGELPDSKAWDDLAAYDSPCRDLDDSHTLSPRIPLDAAAKSSQVRVLSSKFGTFAGMTGANVTGFAFNDVSFQNQIWNPILPTVINTGNYTSKNIATVTFDVDGYVDLILNNLDFGIDHPYHLHGNDFQLIKRGNGALTVEQAMNMDLSVKNPLRRDTIFIPGDSYAIIRIRTDNPGVWALHCHIGWHLAVGKLAAVIVRPDEVRKCEQPDKWLGLCAGQNIHEEGPAKRSLPPATGRTRHLESLKEVKNKIIHRRGLKDV
ncbi:uncharacterized protein L201_005384 [Kwoniella dendrophila CBS 6074]|uniref:Laccase n=1 Tax=Kwoniella dendrophila CBS 6074 TaxID=1295534 RepID=A0AAX4JZ20_9TREE